MKKILSVLGILVAYFALVSCTGAKKSEKYSFETYYNDRFEFSIDYPETFVLSSEADSGDGAIFNSQDGTTELRIFYDQLLSMNDYPDIKMAYEANKSSLQEFYKGGFSDEELNKDYFVFKGKNDDGTLYEQWSIAREGKYITIYLSYASEDVRAIDDETIKHMVESATFGRQDKPNENTAFLYEFIDKCYKGKNFYTVLLNKDPDLEGYIDPQMDVQRISSPGARPYFYSRMDNFGLLDDTDYETMQLNDLDYTIVELGDLTPCDIDYGANEHGTLYYQQNPLPPTAVDNEDNMVTATIPYADAETMVLYAPLEYKGFTHVVAFYFVQTPAGWKLAYFDESLCSA